MLEVTVGDGRLRAAKDVEGEAPIGLLVSASVILSTLIVGWRRVAPLVGSIISGRPGPACVATVATTVASARVSSIGSARVASIASRGVHLVLAELLELPAVADVVGVLAVKKAIWLAGIADIIFTLAEEFVLQLGGEDGRLYTLVIFCLVPGV